MYGERGGGGGIFWQGPSLISLLKIFAKKTVVPPESGGGGDAKTHISLPGLSQTNIKSSEEWIQQQTISEYGSRSALIWRIRKNNLNQTWFRIPFDFTEELS